MTSAWDTAGLLPVRPPDDLGDGDVVVTGPGAYWECGITEWHLMLGWFAGPETLKRYPDDRERWWEVIETDAAGDRQITHRRVTDEERREADEDIGQELLGRGLPAPPGGFRWFQLVPPGGTGRDVVGAYTRAQGQLPRPYDTALETAYARAAIEELYRLPVTPPSTIPPPAGEPEAEDPAITARHRAQQTRQAELMAGPAGAVAILRCRSLHRSLPFYTRLGFQSEELDGYAFLRRGPVELHLSQTSTTSPGGCLIRIPDASALWHRLQDLEMVGPLREDSPGVVSFTLLDPDHNHLIVISGR